MRLERGGEEVFSGADGIWRGRGAEIKGAQARGGGWFCVGGGESTGGRGGYFGRIFMKTYLFLAVRPSSGNTTRSRHGNGCCVPEAQTIIAQRFNVGRSISFCKSRIGRLNAPVEAQPSFRDLGLDNSDPSVETLGYSQSSLGDATANPTRYPGTVALRQIET